MLPKVLIPLIFNLLFTQGFDFGLNIFDQTSGPNSISACSDENTVADVAFIKMGTYSK